MIHVYTYQKNDFETQYACKAVWWELEAVFYKTEAALHFVEVFFSTYMPPDG